MSIMTGVFIAAAVLICLPLLGVLAFGLLLGAVHGAELRQQDDVGDDTVAQYGRYDPDALAAEWHRQQGENRG